MDTRTKNSASVEDSGISNFAKQHLSVVAFNFHPHIQKRHQILHKQHKTPTSRSCSGYWLKWQDTAKHGKTHLAAQSPHNPPGFQVVAGNLKTAQDRGRSKGHHAILFSKLSSPHCNPIALCCNMLFFSNAPRKTLEYN